MENSKMKKIISILVLGLALFLLLSYFPSNTFVNDNTLGEGDNYAISVPAKPPKPPER